MRRFIIIGSKDYIKVGEKKGFAQAKYRKKSQLKKMIKDDWVICYSSKNNYKGRESYQKFIAVEKVEDDAYRIVLFLILFFGLILNH